MARETTIGMCLEIEVLPTPTPDAMELVTPYLTKSASLGATTKVNLDPTDPTLVAGGYVVGDLVYLDQTGWPSIDGKLHRIATIVTTSGSEGITISTDTFAESGAAAALSVGHAMSWSECVCYAEFNQDAGAPGEVDATTVCDLVRVNLPGLPNLGTITFSGPADLDDGGQVALQAAEADALPRFVRWKTRRGMMGVLHGTISSFNIVPGGVEAVVTYNASLTLDAKPYYFKALS